jgi:dehydrogenase/reductase SDR family member 7B
VSLYFKNKTIWITGASSGIGEALAYKFAKLNANLILSSRREDELSRVAAKCTELGSQVSIFPFDLANSSQIEATAEKVLNTYKNVDILINNGGISQRSLVIETSLEIDRKIMEIDFFSGLILTKKLLPSMVQKKSGHIVVISSITGQFGFPLRSSYAAAKHALIGFYESLWAELHNQGIDVTIVCPGRVRTNISYHALTKSGEPHGIMDHGLNNGLSPEACASKIVKAIRNKKVLTNIGGKELLMIYLKRYTPWIFYKLVSRVKPT